MTRRNSISAYIHIENWCVVAFMILLRIISEYMYVAYSIYGGLLTDALLPQGFFVEINPAVRISFR
jgi:hypothetical protein